METWPPTASRRRKLGAEASRAGGRLPRTLSHGPCLPSCSVFTQQRWHSGHGSCPGRWGRCGLHGVQTAKPGLHDRGQVPAPARPLPLCHPGARVKASGAHASPVKWADTGSLSGRCEGWTTARAPGEVPATEKRVGRSPPLRPRRGLRPVLPLGRGCRPRLTRSRVSPPPGVATSQPPTAPQCSVCLTQSRALEGWHPAPAGSFRDRRTPGQLAGAKAWDTHGWPWDCNGTPGLAWGAGRAGKTSWGRGGGRPEGRGRVASAKVGQAGRRVRTAVGARGSPDAHHGHERSREAGAN